MNSPRHQIANRIAGKIKEFELCNPFGGDVERAVRGHHYIIFFSRPSSLEGTVSVYNEIFIVVSWKTNYLLPRHGSVKFSDEAKAIEFIKTAFVYSDMTTALVEMGLL